MIKREEIPVVRDWLGKCTLNEVPKIIGLCNQLLTEIEMQQDVIEQHTNQFLNGGLNATNQTRNDTNGTRSNPEVSDIRQPEPARTIPEVSPLEEARHSGGDSGHSTEAEDDLPEHLDYRRKKARSPEVMDGSRLGAEVDREVRTEEGDVTPSGQSIDAALTRNQRRRQKRKQRKARK